MTGFNEYWKEKAQKIRKSWAAKAKRFAEKIISPGILSS